MPPKVIMRWAKITSKAQADKATGHNYRTDRVANADQEPLYPNVEFINTAGRGYWELAEEQIAEVVTRKVRDDQVRCMEVILTASPEFFERDAQGRARDYSADQWAKDQVDFLKKTFGEKYVLSCTLHQDEKTPHFHAVIVPITEDGRLSAKDLFNPKTLTDYQSQYAESMQVHGLERGVEHSQAKHQDMKRMYAQQAESSAEVRAQLGPASPYQDVEVKRPSMLEALNLPAWEAKTTAQVNEQARAQVEAANQRAKKATDLAQENAAAKEQVRVLQKQLKTVEVLKEKNYEGMKQAQGELKRAEQEKIRLAIDLVQGKAAPASLLQMGAEQREKDRLETKRVFEVHLVKGDYSDFQTYVGGIRKQGFKFRNSTPDNPNQVEHPTGSAFTYAEISPNGRKMGKQVEEQLQARQERAEKLALEVKQAEIRKVEQARQQVATKELSLMDRAFKIYRWKVSAETLTACLIVPKDIADKVAESLRIGGRSYASSLGVQGEPSRGDGMKAVYVKYEPDFAHQIGGHFDRIRRSGGQVYEHAGSQSRREQFEVKPQAQPIRQRGQGPSKGFEIGG